MDNNENGQMGEMNTNQDGFTIPPAQPMDNGQQGDFNQTQNDFTAPPAQPMNNEQQGNFDQTQNNFAAPPVQPTYEQPMNYGQGGYNDFSGGAKPSKKKGGLIAALIVVLVAGLGVLAFVGLRDPFLKATDPKGYLQKIYNGSIKADNNEEAPISVSMSFQIDDMKLAGMSQINSFGRLGIDSTLKMDSETGRAEGSLEVQLGAKDKLVLNYAVDDKDTTYFEVPQLLDMIISIDLREVSDILEVLELNMDDYMSTPEQVEFTFDDLLDAGKVSKGEKKPLVIDEKVNVEYMLLNIPKKEATTLLNKTTEDIEYVGGDIVIGFGIYKKEIVSITISELVFAEPTSRTEISLNDVVVEALNDKIYAFGEMEVEGIGVDIVMNGTTKEEKDSYQMDYVVNISASGLFSMDFSGEYKVTKLDEFVYDMAIEKAKSFNDIMNAGIFEWSALMEEIYSNYEQLRLIPAEFEGVIEALIEEYMYGSYDDDDYSKLTYEEFLVVFAGFEEFMSEDELIELYEEITGNVYVKSGASTGTQKETETEKPQYDFSKTGIKYGVVAEVVKTDIGAEYQVIPLETEVILLVKNNNTSGNLSLEFDIVYYDNEGNVLDTDWEYGRMLGAGREAAISLRGPRDSNYDNMPYAKYEINVKENSYLETMYSDAYDQVEVSHNKSGDKIYVQFKNNSEKIIDSIDGLVLYYKGENIVGSSLIYVYDIDPEKTVTDQAYVPYDFENRKDLDYDTYTLNINYVIIEKE